VRTDDVMAWRQAFVGALQGNSQSARAAQDIILA
jgi:hypothetical protein